jgi:hypothetical protein
VAVLTEEADGTLQLLTTQPLPGCPAPGDAAFDPAKQILYVGCGPTAQPNTVNEYSAYQPSSDQSLQYRAIALNDQVNTGPTGIVFSNSVLGNDFLVSYYYSATAVDYVSYVNNSQNKPVVFGAPAGALGGCEGIAAYGASVFVSNSTKDTIAVFGPGTSGPPNDTPNGTVVLGQTLK